MATELAYADPASCEMLKRAEAEHIDTILDRYDAVQPQCKFGALGVCCRICSMGPCRINLNGKSPQTGACGANAVAPGSYSATIAPLDFIICAAGEAE